MYGLIGEIKAVKGGRDELSGILAGIGDMPGCLSYVVSLDASDPAAIWVTEVWLSAAHHADSLSMPEVRAAIERGRPLISGFGRRFETEPVGGVGLP